MFIRSYLSSPPPSSTKDLLCEKQHSLQINSLILEQTLLTNSSCSSAANGILRSLRNNIGKLYIHHLLVSVHSFISSTVSRVHQAFSFFFLFFFFSCSKDFVVAFSNSHREVRNFVSGIATGLEYTVLKSLIELATFHVPTHARDFSDTRTSFPYVLINLSHSHADYRFKNNLFNLLNQESLPLVPPSILNVKTSAYAPT